MIIPWSPALTATRVGLFPSLPRDTLCYREDWEFQNKIKYKNVQDKTRLIM